MIRVYEAAENCITGIITICRLHKTILWGSSEGEWDGHGM
jgi:hypothetical protein